MGVDLVVRIYLLGPLLLAALFTGVLAYKAGARRARLTLPLVPLLLIVQVVLLNGPPDRLGDILEPPRLYGVYAVLALSFLWAGLWAIAVIVARELRRRR